MRSPALLRKNGSDSHADFLRPLSVQQEKEDHPDSGSQVFTQISWQVKLLKQGNTICILLLNF